DLARPFHRAEHGDHSFLTREREMTHLRCALVTGLLPDHLIVGPEGAVDQDAIGSIETLRDSSVDCGDSGRIEKRLCVANVFDLDRDVVALALVAAMRRIRRRVAAHGDRSEAKAGQRGNIEMAIINNWKARRIL